MLCRGRDGLEAYPLFRSKLGAATIRSPLQVSLNPKREARQSTLPLGDNGLALEKIGVVEEDFLRFLKNDILGRFGG